LSKTFRNRLILEIKERISRENENLEALQRKAIVLANRFAMFDEEDVSFRRTFTNWRLRKTRDAIWDVKLVIEGLESRLEMLTQ